MRLFDNIMRSKLKLFGITFEFIDVLFAVVILTLGLFARTYLFNIESGDFQTAFSDWQKEIDVEGAWGYLGIDPFNSDRSSFDQNIMMQYLVCIISLFSGLIPNDLYLVKTLSVIVDYIAAFVLMKIVFEMTHDSHKSVIGLALGMMLPTIVMNSGAWAQNDIIYTTFILLSFLSLLRGKDLQVFIFAGFAYAFKQQALFFIPVLIFMWLKNKLKIRYILAMPVVYFLGLIPARLAGRPWASLLNVYSYQQGQFSRLSLNYPNIYTVLTSDMTTNMCRMLAGTGTVIVVMMLGVMALYIYTTNFKVTRMFMLTLSVFTIELVVYCLPCMHERYGFVAEILAFIYGMYGMKRLCVAIGFEVIAMTTYSRYLFGSTVAYLYPFAGLLLVLICVVGYDLYQQMHGQIVEDIEDTKNKNMQEVME